MSAAKQRAKAKKNPPTVRLRAHAAQIRIIARHAPMPDGTRNRFHAIADGIDEISDILDGQVIVVRGKLTLKPISWTGEKPIEPS